MPPADPSPPSRPSRESGSDDSRLEEVLDQYLAELANGATPDQEGYLRRFPDLAEPLKSVFRTLEFVETTSRALDGAHLSEGQRLGDFEIVREVGRGGMGVVYEAVQRSLDRRVALKVLPAGVLLGGPTASKRFAREAAIAARLHHPHLVPVYAVGEEQGIHYFAMQFIEGRSLSARVKGKRREGTRADAAWRERVVRWGAEVAEALAHAHAQGTIHRDVKPSNLLVDEDGAAWVTDFGLARGDALASITFTGDIVGTARYMSPEQASGSRDLDPRTDVYSLGATLYELLALTPPFDGESREEVLNQIATRDAKPLRRVDRGIPRELETIVTRCMERDPERRYATAREVAEECRRVLAGEAIRARRPSGPARAARVIGRHRVRAVGLMLLALMSITTIALVMRARHAAGQARLDDASEAILFEHDFGRGETLLEEAESFGIDAAELDLYRGLLEILDRPSVAAFAPLERALNRDPHDHEAGLALACAHNALADFPTGRRLFEEHSRGEITTALGWLLHGLAQSHFPRSDAIPSFDRAIELRRDFTPANVQRAVHRGRILLTEGDRSQLQPMLDDGEACVIFRPTSARSWAVRASGRMSAAAFAATQPDLVAEREEWLAQCRRDLERALELRRPDDPYPLIRQGLFLRYVGEDRAAAEVLAEASEVVRRRTGSLDPVVVHHRAISLHARGEWETALAEVTPLCESAPTLYGLWLHRAMMLAEAGRLEEAREVTREIMGRVEENATALFCAAAVREYLGDREGAAAAVGALVDRSAEEVTFEDSRQEDLGPAAEYLLDRIDAATLLAASEKVPSLQCEHAFLVAMRELAAGRRDTGLEALRTCLATGVWTFGEFRYAQAMLARAAEDPTWPAWIETD